MSVPDVWVWQNLLSAGAVLPSIPASPEQYNVRVRPDAVLGLPYMAPMHQQTRGFARPRYQVRSRCVSAGVR